MKVVAMMTPDPKYLAMKKHHLGNPPSLPKRRANTGNTAPNMEPTMITKMEEMRSPMRPSNSLPGSQASARLRRTESITIEIEENRLKQIRGDQKTTRGCSKKAKR